MSENNSEFSLLLIETDLNVAYGRTVNYAGISNTISDTLMTDGLTNSEDPSNTAECSSLTKAGNAFLSIDLGDNLPVRVVGIFGKGGSHNSI